MNTDYTVLVLVQDVFLKLGLLGILEEYLSNKSLVNNFVIFTPEHYYKVLEENFSPYNTVFLVLTHEQNYPFLNQLPLKRIPFSTTPLQLIELFKTCTPAFNKKEQQEREVLLSKREILFINFCEHGLSPAETSREMGLHIKTIYDLRLSVLKKIGCSSFNELNILIHSPVFKKWMSSQRINIDSATPGNTTTEHFIPLKSTDAILQQ